MFRKTIILLLGVLFMAEISVAQQPRIYKEVRKLVKVYFRQGSYEIDEDYMGNKATLEEFAKTINGFCNDTTAKFRQLRIVSSASPEGTKKINDFLVEKRAEAITEWISRKISVKLGHSIEQTGIDWKVLTELVGKSEDVPMKEAVLDILRNTPEQERLQKLMELENGAPYKWILNNIFTQMRYASARAEFWWETEPGLIITSPDPYLPAQQCTGVVTYEKIIPDDLVPVVKAHADWITSVVPTKDSVTFVALNNPYAKPRSAKIVLQCYGKEYEVVAVQQATVPEFTIVTESPVGYPAEGGNGKIEFKKNVIDDIVPTVTCDSAWIGSIEATKDGITYTVAPNGAQEPRSAVIYVECYGQKRSVVVNQQKAKCECEKPFYMAVKTNMLYDLAAVPNVGVEFYLGKNWSIAGNWGYSWWKSDKSHWYWRYYGGDLAVRKWFGKAANNKPLTGHHAGIYGQILTYDFETGNRGFLADRWSYAVGAEYGYSLPIARRLNIDFTMGLGYHWGEFKEYLPIDGHYVWQVTKNRKYIGPTKLEVSLVWLIGCGNYNKEKGGKR